MASHADGCYTKKWETELLEQDAAPPIAGRMIMGPSVAVDITVERNAAPPKSAALISRCVRWRALHEYAANGPLPS